MAVTDEFVEQVSEALDKLGYSVDTETDIISSAEDIDDSLVVLPGMKQSAGGGWIGYISVRLNVFKNYLDNISDGIQAAWNRWFGTSSSTGVQGQWSDLVGDVESTITASERVNATLTGSMLSVTDRYGTTTTADLKGEKGEGFSIYRTYESVAAMNADAENVPEGKLVCIASDTEDPDNAKLYVKNSDGGFTFQTDLSGAQGIKGDKGDKGDPGTTDYNELDNKPEVATTEDIDDIYE